MEDEEQSIDDAKRDAFSNVIYGHNYIDLVFDENKGPVINLMNKVDKAFGEAGLAVVPVKLSDEQVRDVLEEQEKMREIPLQASVTAGVKRSWACMLKAVSTTRQLTGRTVQLTKSND